MINIVVESSGFEHFGFSEHDVFERKQQVSYSFVL